MSARYFHRRSVFPFVCLMTSLLLAAAGSRAEIIAVDDFDYQCTLTEGANGGTGWAGAWTGLNLITAGSLHFGNYAAKGHKLTTHGQPASATNRYSFRTLSTLDRERWTDNDRFGRPGTVLWIGFLINVPGGANGGYGGVSLYDQGNEQAFLGQTGLSNVWGFARAGRASQFGDVMGDKNPTFLVYRIAFTGREAQIQMWINPEPGGKEPSPSEIAASDSAGKFHFDSVRVTSEPVPFSIDGLRIGTTYGDVAPVSSRTPLWIAALIAAFVILDAWALALFLKHRRKQRLRGEHPPPLPGAASQSS
jgi:hypothetical protein